MNYLRDPKDVIVNGRSLDDIIQDHLHWLKEDVDGWENKRMQFWHIDLRYVDLSDTILDKAGLYDCDLHGSDLSSASLVQACLDDCDLRGCIFNSADLGQCSMRGVYMSNAEMKNCRHTKGLNLSWADLYKCDFDYTHLTDVDLSKSNLNRANLFYVNIMHSNLSNTKLSNANLTNALIENSQLHMTDLTDANLINVKFYNVDLFCANFRRANLFNGIFDNTDINCTTFINSNLSCVKFIDTKSKLLEYRKGKVLTESIIGYKKCYGFDTHKLDTIVKLEIPRGAIVFSIDGSKCRTNKAKVLEIEGADRAISNFKYMSYYVGDEINIYNFNCEYNIECAEGIHFFMSRDDAMNYKSS